MSQLRDTETVRACFIAAYPEHAELLAGLPEVSRAKFLADWAETLDGQRRLRVHRPGHAPEPTPE